MMPSKFISIDEYIASFAAEVQEILHTIRAIIKEKVPDSVEGIAYDMPAYKTHGRVLVYPLRPDWADRGVQCL